MTCSKWLSTVVFTALALPVVAQKSGCDLVTPDEAAAVFGSPVTKQGTGPTCTFKASSSTAALVVHTSKITSDAFKARKDSFAKSGVKVADEASLGTAFSAVRPDSTRIYIFKNGQLVRVEFNDSSKGKAPAGLLDKLRTAAKQAAARV